MPPLRPAWSMLGHLTPGFVARTGLSPATQVLCGIHDSSANLYRYQAAGLSDMTVVSTGTWLVAINDRPDIGTMAERTGLSWNSDVHGRPLTGVLMMAGREYAAIAPATKPAPVAPDDLAGLTASFPAAPDSRVVHSDGLTTQQRQALTVLYLALLTDMALDQLPPAARVMLDGSFVGEPLFAALVAALRAEPICVSNDRYGTATGAALLATHTSRTEPAPIMLSQARPADLPGLAMYKHAWRERAGTWSES